MKIIKNILFLLLMALMSGCATDIEIMNLIDTSVPFELKFNPKNTVQQNETTEIIEINTEKWNRLIEWIEKNNDEWENSPASYVCEINIRQGEFQIATSIDAECVVISFIDNNGEPKQYTKRIKKGELNFLTTFDVNKSANKCAKCDLQIIKKVHDNIDKLTYKIIHEFICTIDKSCSNNVEFSEWSSEMLIKMIEHNPNMFFKVIQNENGDKQKYVISEFENPVIEFDEQELYNKIKNADIEKGLKNDYLNSLISIARKSNIRIKK